MADMKPFAVTESYITDSKYYDEFADGAKGDSEAPKENGSRLQKARATPEQGSQPKELLEDKAILQPKKVIRPAPKGPQITISSTEGRYAGSTEEKRAIASPALSGNRRQVGRIAIRPAPTCQEDILARDEAQSCQAENECEGCEPEEREEAISQALFQY